MGYAPRVNVDVARVPTRGGTVLYWSCLLRPIRTVRAGLPAPFASLGHLLSSHQALTRVAAAALIFTLVIVFSQQEATQAGPQAAQPVPKSLLPDNVGLGIATGDDVHLTFDEPMDPDSVEAALQLAPDQDASLSWNDDQTALAIAPTGLWRADAVYLITVDPSARTASGSVLPAPRRYSFSTQTAPVVSDFQVRLAEIDLPQDESVDGATAALRLDHDVPARKTLSPSDTAREVSASSSIRISFSTPMNRADVEEAFTIAPEVTGELSWANGELVFSPTERLEPGGRYTISLADARSTTGNELGGKTNFSFLVRAEPQLTRTSPTLGAQDVEPASVEMWFSQPMDVDATNAAFSLVDTSTGRLVAGRLNWNETATQLVYSPDATFRGGRTFAVVLGEGATDADGNAIAAEWTFTTKAGVEAPAAAPSSRGAAGAAAAPAPAPVAFVPGPASGLEGYGINQINAARAAYGLGPLALDPTMSAVASAHAWDQLNRGYYSHNTLGSGASVQQRLAAAGVGFSAAGENQCHASMGMGAQGTMDWCHGSFMAEPWPGYWNHIGNILSSRYTRVGIGVADNGSRVVVTWDFAN